MMQSVVEKKKSGNIDSNYLTSINIEKASSTYKTIENLEDTGEIKRLEAKLERLKKGHGKKMSADKFLKELGKW